MEKNLERSKTHGISLSALLSEKLEKTAAEMGMSKSSIVAMALNDFFKKEDVREK